jgi:type IX secretion system substrate protein
MKKFYILIIALFAFSISSNCQTVDSAEYFFDSDFTQGSGFPIAVTSDDTISLSNVPINSAGLSFGYHWLYLRVKDSDGHWGNYRKQRFYVYDNTPIIYPVDTPRLVLAEYWIDVIPTPGSGSFIALNPDDTIFYNDSIPGAQLNDDGHLVSVRVKDNKELWSFIKSDWIGKVSIEQTSDYFIREGSKTKLNVQITNRSSVDLVELYLVMKASRDFNAQFELAADSINGVSVGNISKTIFVGGDNPHYDMPLWLGKLQANQTVSYDFYVTFPSLLPHADLNITFEVLGSKKSDMQTYFEHFGADSSAFLSLYSGSLINSIDAIKDTLGLDTLNYSILSDSLQSWMINNNNLFNELMPLNFIPKVYLKNCFNASFTDSIINMINLVVYNILKYSTYNVGSFDNDTSNFLKYSEKSQNINCNCGGQLSFSSLPCLPLEPKFLFYISSGCQDRCKCVCDGNRWQRISDPHSAIDLNIKPNANDFSWNQWDSCKMSVRSMFAGIVHYVDDPVGGHQIFINSIDDNGQSFSVGYFHLCERTVQDGDSIPPCTVIGKVGRSGSGADGIHLHIESLTLPPSCLMSFETEYDVLDPVEALLDHSCQPLNSLPGDCFSLEEVGAPCFIPDYWYFSPDGTCPSEWKLNESCSNHESIQSGDPNSKVGNIGFSSAHYIKPTDELHYGIFYANVDSATAPTQVAIFRDTLDLTKVYKSTFYFESFTAGEMLVILPDSVHIQNLDTIYQEEPINGEYVHIEASFDTVSGAIEIIMTSIDPATMMPETNPLEGFLPPDTTDFDGNGLVSFKVMPVSTIPDDTVIYNTAHIIFDSNPAIATGTWFNTIDRIEPTSNVITLPPTTYDTTFAVHWTGTDDGAGIIDFDIYAKLSGDTAFTKWLSHTSLDSAMFTGVWDSTYQFYSIAYDSVGNVENKLDTVEAFTTLQNPVGISYIYNSMDLKIYPNPTSGKLTVEAVLQNNEIANVEIFNLLDQKLFSFDLSDSGKKYVKKEIDVSSVKNGVYFLKMNLKGQSITKKFILKKN